MNRAVELLENLESYDFHCEAGPLKNCLDWIELRKLIEGRQAGAEQDGGSA